MSLNILHVPNISILKDTLINKGSEEVFFKYIRKRECFIGPSDSIDFLEQFIKKYRKFENNNKIFYEL